MKEVIEKFSSFDRLELENKKNGAANPEISL